jgi:uncharacterized ubiquitin-like protein YukD
MEEINQINKLSNSLKETLADSDLQNVTSDLAETFTDTLLTEGLLKEIPIIGTIIGLTKASISLNERLLIKKLIYFLSELKDINIEKRQQLIDQIEVSEKSRVNVGERLLYIIDKCDDHITARYVAILFSAFLNEKIKYHEFLRGSTIIQKLFLHDLEQFIKTEIKQLERKITRYDIGISDYENSLINAGICMTDLEPVTVQDQEDPEASMFERYRVDGGDMQLYLTEIGHLLKTNLHSC